MDIVQAIKNKQLFRPVFRDLSSWSSWLVLLKALFGLQMDDKELTLYKEFAPVGKNLPSSHFVNSGPSWVDVEENPSSCR